ncbi:MAG TPA: glycosyltransferase family 2 protein [Burkholderiales bacterium]|jgi:glycosyltransferase involved in cell wall biosynthesis|nr:glycosyltransferase family 2 protein [Burkholderiales bacterium]
MALSVAIITRDAASQLEGCLASVAFAEEVVVVDSGSTDGTVELAARSGARVVRKEWLGYGAQKQFAVDAASHEWVLCVDADECLSSELREAIVAELKAPRGFVYAISRRNRFLGRWLKHGEGYPDWNVRLFHRGHARWGSEPVHEKITSRSPVLRLRGDLLHDSAETLEKYLDKQNRYTSIQAESLRAAGRRANALQLVLSPALRFIKFYLLRLGFLDGVPGLVHVAIGCMNSFNKYAKLKALERASK